MGAVWIVTVIAAVGLLTGAVAAAIAQRNVIAKLRHKNWENEQYVVELEQEVKNSHLHERLLREAYDRVTEKALEYASKPPVVIQPPDVVPIVKELGESIGTAIYGRQQEVQQDLQRQMQETSMVHEQPPPGQWFPDAEFDPGMGPMPGPGGWINGQANQQMPPPEGQTPTHVVVDGQLVRVDGQSTFQSGVSAPPPQGGVE